MWRSMILALGLVASSPALFAQGSNDDIRIFKRGDADNNNTVNMTDAVYINSWLYSGGPEPPCLNQADANDDGRVDGSDPIYILNWLYQGGPAPPYPGPYNTVCVNDTVPYPGCANPCS